MPGDLFVDILEEAGKGRGRRGSLELDGGARLGLDLVDHARVGRGVEPAPRAEERAVARERVLGRLPLEGDALVAVARRVVRRRVGADAVGERLDEGGAAAPPRLVDGGAARRVDREDVVSVDADAFEAVGE